jgi:ADP-heptose:LPS heptosyltransferase
MLPGVDTVIVFDAPWVGDDAPAVDPQAIDDLLHEIAAVAPDEAFIFTSFHQSPLPMALLLRLAGVSRISAISEDYPGSLLDVRHRGVPDDVHEVERALSLVAAAGYTLPPNDEGRLAMRVAPRNPLASLRRYVVVHPGATVPARAWDPRANRDLVRALVRSGERVVVTGSAGERALCAAVAGDEATNLAGETDLPTLARIIADADALVVGNTGAAHVAAAVGTPTVSLFPPTVPAVRFRPWRVPHVLLGDQEIECRGCRARNCPLEDQPCLGVVTIDDVLAALASLREPREVMA